MLYKGYEILELENIVKVFNIKNFNLKHIFECGQCFRWYLEDDGSYTGIAYGKVINVQIIEETFIINNTTFEDFKNIWFHYFDMDRDYDEIKNRLKGNSIIDRAIEFGYGIRILNQEIWEILISFILSTNNNIPRIKKIINDLSKELGMKVLYKNKEYYTFPTPIKLSEANLDIINLCKAGYRCPYIKTTATIVANGEVDLNNLKNLLTKNAIHELCNLVGVGEKVASCVLLFSGTKIDTFPIDVWIRKIIEENFLKKKATLKEIKDFADKSFGDLKGFAQQYLFYYFRENN